MNELYCIGHYAMLSLRNMAQLPADTVTVTLTATLLALATGIGSTVNTILLIVLLIAMMMDMITRLGSIFRSQGLERFSSDKFVGGLIGKLMRLGVVMLAALIDIALSVLFPLSGDLVGTYTPTTKSALIYLFVGEGISILNNVRKSEGDDAIPVMVVRALDRLRRGGAEPPMRRHYDVEAVELERELKSSAAPDAGPQPGDRDAKRRRKTSS